MGSLAEFIISFFNLLEAEGKTLRRAVARAGLSLALAGVVGVLLAAGLILVLWAAYQYLRTGLGPASAALVDGLIAFLLAGMMAWIANRHAR